MVRLNGGAKGTELPARRLRHSCSWTSRCPRTQALPKALQASLRASSVAKAPGCRRAASTTRSPASRRRSSSSSTDPLPVGPAAVVVAPPLKGSRWVVGGGCCTPYSYHRGATLPINGGVACRRALRHRLRAVERQGHAARRRHRQAVGATPISATRSIRSPTGPWWRPRTACPSRCPGKLPADATIQMAARQSCRRRYRRWPLRLLRAYAAGQPAR